MKKILMAVALSMFLMSFNFIGVVNAKENISTRSIETLTATGTIRLNQGGSDRGYVDCFAKIDYNIQARTYKVVSVYVQPHISWTSPFLSVGKDNLTSTPAVGTTFQKGSAIFVNFWAREGTSGAMWDYSCRVVY